MRTIWLLSFLVLLAPGCSKQPYQLAPVSGKVTLNGKPLAKAWVHFAPMATEGNQNPGPTSHGQTDAEGKFKLIVDPDRPGAVVGKSRVFISTLDPGAEYKDLPDAGVKVLAKDRVPARYNQETQETFVVPAGGTDKADFHLTAP